MSDDRSIRPASSSAGDLVFSCILALAAAAVTLILASYEANAHRSPKILLVSLFAGQLWWTSSWAAAATVHRLLRATVLIVAILAVTVALVLMLSDDVLADAARGLATSTVFAAPPYAAALFLRYCFSRRSRDQAKALRFPVKELLAWTSLCALISWGLSRADFSHLIDLYEVTIYVVAAGMLAGVAAATFIAPNALSMSSKALAVVMLLIFLCAMKVRFESSIEPGIPAGMIGGFAYVLLAVLVWKADQRLAAIDS